MVGDRDDARLPYGIAILVKKGDIAFHINRAAAGRVVAEMRVAFVAVAMRAGGCLGSRAEPSQGGDSDRQEQVFHKMNGMHPLRRHPWRFIRRSENFLRPDFQHLIRGRLQRRGKAATVA